MMIQFDQKDLKKYVKLNKIILSLSGIQEDEEILKRISESFSEESREKLRGFGLIEGEYNLDQLEEVLLGNGGNKIKVEEEFLIPQKSEETVQQYLKRLKELLPQMGEEAPSIEEFLEIFSKGIHPNLKETTINFITFSLMRSEPPLKI